MIDFENGDILKLKADNGKRANHVDEMLITDETVRDFVVFTDKRVIACNIQGVTGMRRDFTSMPYSKVSVFSIETAGLMDLDSELEMYFPGVGRVHFDFTGNSDIRAIGQAIGRYVLQ